MWRPPAPWWRQLACGEAEAEVGRGLRETAKWICRVRVEVGDGDSAKADRWGQPPGPREARERAAVAGLMAGL